ELSAPLAQRLHPPLKGEGRRAAREARCETGWGELCRKSHPTPLASLATLPLQGRVNEQVATPCPNNPPSEREILATIKPSGWAMLRRAVHRSGAFMRVFFTALIVAIGLASFWAAPLAAQPAHAQADRAA